jgi:transposase-like protein
MNTRNRTSSEHIGYGLYFYFSGLSLRKTSERLLSCFIKRNHVSINLELDINKSINPKRYLKGKRKKIEEFIIDETLIKIGSELIDMALDCYYRISE